MCTGNKTETKVCKGSCAGSDAQKLPAEPVEQFKKCHESADKESDETPA
jgi:hypothetical protein